MSVLGIYFGSRIVSIVENAGKKILNNIRINRSTFSISGLEEKVPDELKIATAVLDELSKNNIKAREANICLAGKDMIIRTFEMPMLSSSELQNAVNFEVKKYIPFKVTDLVSDFQVLPDKANRKNLILFVGIKRETLDKYLAILDQLKIKTVSIEYAAFSMIRLLQLAGEKKKSVTGLLSIGLQEGDEINYTVLENGFPLFSRDIDLMVEAADASSPNKSEVNAILEKLKIEVRVSLDYYHRKFPLKNIQKIFFLCAADQRPEIEGLMQELGFPAQYLDIARYTGKASAFSLSVIKGYACALFKSVKTPLRINLLAAKAKPKSPVQLPLEEAGISEWNWAEFFAGLHIQPLVVLVCVLMLLGAFLFGTYQKLPLQKELTQVISLRPEVATIDKESSYETLLEKDNEYKAKIETFAKLIKHEFYNTEILDAIPVLLPKDIWLTRLSFTKDMAKIDLSIGGSLYLNDSQKEIELVHEFFRNLKMSPAITKYFRPQDITITSIEKGKIGVLESTDFTITCQAVSAEVK